MADDAVIASQVITVVNALGDVAATVVRSPRSTVEPHREGKLGRRALQVLQGLTHDPRGLVEDERVLGEGGMGVVKLARQVALDRPVAVKLLKNAGATKDVEALLSEAWLAGALEHPGILPIYALTLSLDGMPMLVMKRIEGVTWSALLKGKAELATFAPGRSPLESHLRVAMQLCNAVHFANSRNVVHRDLKPDNVMLGQFGEVYLMDWGIATEHGPTDQFAGTPAYMAPEMLGRPGSVLSARTDVYLLGAMLFEVAVGRAPHLRESLNAMLESVVRSKPELPAEVPGELANLIRRCMSAKPDDRPESALVVRQALEAFLEHQGSRELAAQSEARARELEQAIAEPQPDSLRVSRLFTECRFGLQQALRAWPENSDAAFRLAQVSESMVLFELSGGELNAAKTLLADLKAPSAAVLEALARAEADAAQKADELERLKRLAKSLDPLTGVRRRMLAAMALGGLWVVAPAIRHVLGRTVGFDDDLLAAVPIAALSALLVFAVARRTPEHLRTPLNQQIARLLLFVLITQMVTTLGLTALGFDAGLYGAAVLLWYWTLVSGLVAMLFVREAWPSVVSFMLGTVAAVRWPESGNLFGSLANVGLWLNMVHLFLKQRRQLAERASSGQR